MKRVNHHSRNGWLEFSAIGRKEKGTPVFSTSNWHPGAKHPVCFAKIILLILIPLFVFSGCAWFSKPKEEKNAQELISDGMDQFNNEDYKKAVDSFEKLKDWYPFSKYVILAELKIADAYYHLEKYSEAVSAYESFENLHPRNEAVPYVIYQIGLCYYDQIDTVDRDQTSAKNALDTFKRLIRQFPNDSYAYRARERMKVCIKSLAGHDFYVGLFYYKAKHYKAALTRFKSVLTNYPDVGVHEKALSYIALCEDKLTKKPQN